ncbi:MAG: hypothetical protein JXJ22_14400 [Bacteroidales bacterium]|nr:hypothetical protein [Bacteroidales bacterium]
MPKESASQEMKRLPVKSNFNNQYKQPAQKPAAFFIFHMKKIVLTLLILGYLSLHFVSLAQDKEVIIDDLLGTSDEDLFDLLGITKNYHFIYAGFNFNEKAYFAGRDLGIDQFSSTQYLYYLNSKGFLFGIAGVLYEKFEPMWNTTVFTAGYNNSLGKGKIFRFGASVNTNVFSASDTTETALYSSINTGLTLKKKVLGTRLDMSFLIDEGLSANISFDVFASINILKSGDYKVKIEPELSFFLGDETAIYYESGRTLPQSSTSNYYYEDTFGLMNMEIQLPLEVSFKDLDLEFGYNINFPRALGDNPDIRGSSYFNVSIGYLFGLN